MYGYESDEQGQSKLRFGLNPAAARMVKFEWVNNAGKDGAEGEALDVQFAIDGNDRATNYRIFPVIKAFGKDNVEITDQKAPEFQKAVKDVNAIITHILHCFVDVDSIKNAMTAQPISTFKEFCKVAMSLLPADYADRKLDIFFQWQWQIKGENKNTFLELPKKMSYGKWLCPAIPPAEGSEWTEQRHKSPDSQTPIALKYVDGAGKIHPFTRNGWFMNSKFASQQKTEETDLNNIGNGEAADTTADAQGSSEGW